MSNDIVERLRAGTVFVDGPVGTSHISEELTDKLMEEAADEIERLKALLASDIHSCSPMCARPLCVLQRRVEELEAENQRYNEALGDILRAETLRLAQAIALVALPEPPEDK